MVQNRRLVLKVLGIIALKENNYVFISVENLEKYNRRELKSDKNYDVMTFDDGWLADKDACTRRRRCVSNRL